MRHTCPDGSQTRLIRDPKAPVGELARMACPHCGWARHGEAILADAKAILGGIAVRRTLSLG